MAEVFTYPATEKLSQQIERLLNKAHAPFYMEEMVYREPFDYRSTSPAEIISCRLNSGKIISLFCKYAGSHTQYSDGHRGGVEYETTIYKNILSKSSLSSAYFYGSYEDDNNEECLIIQYLDKSNLLKDDHNPDNFSKAATWIGQLHRSFENNLPGDIKNYDREYYMVWLERVEKMADKLKNNYPWLPSVCTYFHDNLYLLTDSKKTFIHGEYYTKNILVENGIIYPIDWESAAIGPGEIDLATLVDGWDDKRRDAAFKSYIESRWPNGNFPEQEFKEIFLLANIYLFFRWTGEYDDADVWINKTEWFQNFYQSLREAGYNQSAEV